MYIKDEGFFREIKSLFADTPFESTKEEDIYNLKNDLVKSLKLSFNQDNVPSNSLPYTILKNISLFSDVHVTESNRDRRTKPTQPNKKKT